MFKFTPGARMWHGMHVYNMEAGSNWYFHKGVCLNNTNVPINVNKHTHKNRIYTYRYACVCTYWSPANSCQKLPQIAHQNVFSICVSGYCKLPSNGFPCNNKPFPISYHFITYSTCWCCVTFLQFVDSVLYKLILSIPLAQAPGTGYVNCKATELVNDIQYDM